MHPHHCRVVAMMRAVMAQPHPTVTIDRETFVRAVFHGWMSCEPHYHIELDRAWRRLAVECADERCDCNDTESVEFELSSWDNEGVV